MSCNTVSHHFMSCYVMSCNVTEHARAAPRSTHALHVTSHHSHFGPFLCGYLQPLLLSARTVHAHVQGRLAGDQGFPSSWIPRSGHEWQRTASVSKRPQASVQAQPCGHQRRNFCRVQVRQRGRLPSLAHVMKKWRCWRGLRACLLRFWGARVLFRQRRELRNCTLLFVVFQVSHEGVLPTSAGCRCSCRIDERCDPIKREEANKSEFDPWISITGFVIGT